MGKNDGKNIGKKMEKWWEKNGKNIGKNYGKKMEKIMGKMGKKILEKNKTMPGRQRWKYAWLKGENFAKIKVPSGKLIITWFVVEEKKKTTVDVICSPAADTYPRTRMSFCLAALITSSQRVRLSSMWQFVFFLRSDKTKSFLQHEIRQKKWKCKQSLGTGY